ncbi:MAG: hypothetical protein JXC32_20565 [Anaerolineae bacterium]|nr:hypothetical protein [Anaerolineae bacterium]
MSNAIYAVAAAAIRTATHRARYSGAQSADRPGQADRHRQDAMALRIVLPPR